MKGNLREVAIELEKCESSSQLIYAFNGTGKTRLSREFKDLIEENNDFGEESMNEKIYCYNSDTEDLFFWDTQTINTKLKIKPNTFTEWIYEVEGCGNDIDDNFARYTKDALTAYYQIGIEGECSEITFSHKNGNEGDSKNIKISRGEESCFKWCVFLTLIQMIVENLNATILNKDKSDKAKEYQEKLEKIKEKQDKLNKKTIQQKIGIQKYDNLIAKQQKDKEEYIYKIKELGDYSGDKNCQFDGLEYVFIDDPVSSLDDTHLIEVAVNLADLIKASTSKKLKFVITTHNALFYNVLHNSLGRNGKKYLLEKTNSETYSLNKQNDSPFAYHIFLIKELEEAIKNNCVKKYHFNLFRNILEKTSTFLGYENWGKILEEIDEKQKTYASRIINISSHSKFSEEEIHILKKEDMEKLKVLLEKFKEKYNFQDMLPKEEVNNDEV